MSNQEGVYSNKPPLFNGTIFMLWRVKIRSYSQALSVNVWEIFEGGYQYLASIPTKDVGNKWYGNNAKVVNAILGGLGEYEFLKVM